MLRSHTLSGRPQVTALDIAKHFRQREKEKKKETLKQTPQLHFVGDIPEVGLYVKCGIMI